MSGESIKITQMQGNGEEASIAHCVRDQPDEQELPVASTSKDLGKTHPFSCGKPP